MVPQASGEVGERTIGKYLSGDEERKRRTDVVGNRKRVFNH